MKLDAKSILVPTVVLLIICVATSAALAGTNMLTRDKIAEQQALKAEASRRVVLNAAESFEAKEDGAYYAGMAGGETVGYVFETEGKGYGGSVKVMTGISAEGEVTGVVILSHAETPGLGANAGQESFRSQYVQAAPEGGLEIVKYQTPAAGQVEALTGATITTKAVTDAVNLAIEEFYGIGGA